MLVVVVVVFVCAWVYRYTSINVYPAGIGDTYIVKGSQVWFSSLGSDARQVEFTELDEADTK